MSRATIVLLQDEMYILVSGFHKAVHDGDLQEAIEHKQAILHYLAWRHDPSVVAVLDDAVRAMEKEQ